MKTATLMNPIGRVQAILRYRELLFALIHKDFDNRYAGSVLGVLWTQLYPLLLLLVYVFVFSVILPAPYDNFPLFLFIGLTLWHFFSTSVMLGSNAIRANASLLGRVHFPRELVVVSVIAIACIDLLMSHSIIALGTLLYGITPSWSWLAVPGLIFLLALICLGLGLLLATATVYLRDVRFFTEVAVLMLMFLSGIFFSISQVPESYQWVMRINPLAVAISAYRRALLEGIWPELWAWVFLSTIAVLFLWLGFRTFEQFEEGFSDAL